MPFRLFAQGWLPTIPGTTPRFGLYRDDRRDDEYLLALDEQDHFRLARGPIEPEVWGSSTTAAASSITRHWSKRASVGSAMTLARPVTVISRPGHTSAGTSLTSNEACAPI
jgi:hypothetical protein